MKIKKITVKKLFGVFNHEISLNNDSHITIIIGENGLGKTVLLEMIDAFFKGHYFYFNSVDFESIEFEFDDRIKWLLSKEMTKEDIPILKITQKNKNDSTYQPIVLNNFSENIVQNFARETPFLRRISSKTWQDRKTGEILDNNEIFYKYKQFFPNQIYDINDTSRKWFLERHEQIKVSLIETQRLISITDKEEKIHRRTVEKYSLDLSKVIKSFLTESTELSSKLDRTYPNRLVERLKESSDITDHHLNGELKRLESKRKLLDAVGLIEIEKDSNILEIEYPEAVIKKVLMLYIEDSFKKIEIFETVAKKIEIFLDIINRRFKHKKIYIEKEEGFLLKSTIIKDRRGNFQRIPVSKLSSGEQNELVLFYLLLFKTEENSIILIDEPEVSLHISWQNSFIEDLKQITKLNNLDVLIATHSPDIIANNWNLRVELKGIE